MKIIKKILCGLFLHNYEKWVDTDGDYKEYSMNHKHQVRKCENCGKVQGRWWTHN